MIILRNVIAHYHTISSHYAHVLQVDVPDQYALFLSKLVKQLYDYA